MFRRAIEVGEGTWQANGDGFEAVWPIKVGGKAFDLRTEIRGVAPPPSGAPVPEAALAAVLLPGMAARRPIRMAHLASERLVGALPELQEKLRGFFPRLRRSRVRHGGVAEVESLSQDGAGIFLSLGIDSLYSLLMLRNAVTDLVLVRGFDITADDEARWTQAVEGAEEVAAWTDKRVVLVRTNVRQLLDEHVDWSQAHGAALAHVGLALTPWLRKITIASTQHAEPYFPHGSHPELDALWSTEWLEVVHHGNESRRIDTLAYLAREKVALDHLRVCRAREADAYNCGHCARCVVAMLGLDVVEALEHCKTLPNEVSEDLLHGIDTWSIPERVELEAVRDAWSEIRPGSQMLEEIRTVLTRVLAAES